MPVPYTIHIQCHGFSCVSPINKCAWPCCLDANTHLASHITESPSAAQVSHSEGPTEGVKQTLEALVQAAAQWQAVGLQRQGSNTGVCLRTNFRLMADIVVKQDGHLLVEEEKQLLIRFQVACTACQRSLSVLKVLSVYTFSKHYAKNKSHTCLVDMSQHLLIPAACCSTRLCSGCRLASSLQAIQGRCV